MTIYPIFDVILRFMIIPSAAMITVFGLGKMIMSDWRDAR